MHGPLKITRARAKQKNYGRTSFFCASPTHKITRSCPQSQQILPKIEILSRAVALLSISDHISYFYFSADATD